MTTPNQRIKTLANVQYAGDIRPAADGHTHLHRGKMFRAGVILDAETSYLFRLTNRSGQTKRGSICLMWYSSDEIPDS